MQVTIIFLFKIYVESLTLVSAYSKEYGHEV